MKELITYKDLLTYLKTLTDKQLKQPIQIADPSPITEEPVVMQSGIAIGTMKEMEFYAARSVTNNAFNPNEIVILVDGNPFGEDGRIYTEYNPEELKKKHKETVRMKVRSIIIIIIIIV